jgi:hypothetical protein
MFFIPTHYGKKINQFNQKEKELLMIDTTMTTIFMKKDEVGISGVEEKIAGVLGKKRTQVVVELLGWEEMNEFNQKEILERMETTKYSYSQFLSDMRKNVKEHDKEEEISQMN